MRVYTESRGEELPHWDQRLPKVHHKHPQVHNDQLVNESEHVERRTAAAKVTACLDSCSVSGRGG